MIYGWKNVFVLKNPDISVQLVFQNSYHKLYFSLSLLQFEIDLNDVHPNLQETDSERFIFMIVCTLDSLMNIENTLIYLLFSDLFAADYDIVEG